MNPINATRIRSVRAWEVVVPAHEGSTDSPQLGQAFGAHTGTPWDLLPVVLLELTMNDGIVALGEVGRGMSLASVEAHLKRLPGISIAAPGLGNLAEDWRAAPPGGLKAAFPPPLYYSPIPLIGALETAILDYAGKKLGCRAVDLLGGAVRERVPVDAWCGRQLPGDLARIVARARERGFSGIKMKSCLGDPLAEQLRAVREAGGENFRVTIDPMFQWLSPLDAAQTFHVIEESGVNVRVEDPYPQDRPELWRRQQQISRVPLIWHARGLEPARRALQERCCDGFNCAGGVWEFMTIAHAVEVLGYDCWHGSAIELGVAQAAHLHAAAAARSCTLPSDIVGGLIRRHMLTTWDWPYASGTLPLPAGPGLGVELDRDAVKHYCKSTATFE